LPSEPFLTHSVLRDALAFGAAALFVALADRRERRRVLRVLLLGVLGYVVRAAGHLAPAIGLTTAAPALDIAGRSIAAIAAVALAGTLFFDVLLPLVKMRPPRILRDLAIAAGSIAATLAVLSSGRVEIVGIVATSAVLTAVIGWALQDTLANVMGGLALQLDGSVKAGDWVTFGETTGLVREIGWRQTSIETRNRDLAVVPNSLFMKTAVVLRGRGMGDVESERRWVWFNVDSGVAPTEVIARVEEALRRDAVPGVDREPAPECIFFDFAESSSRFAVRYWLTDMFRADATDSVVRARIWFALRRAGISLSVPVRHVVLTPDDAESRARALEAERGARRALLDRVSIFAPLTPEERDGLAKTIAFTPFAVGESLVVQGAEGHHLYVLTKGRVEVRVSVDSGAPRSVATLAAPDFFGEMGLLTGEPRKATVVALTDAEAWRVEKSHFKEILEKRPAVAEAIAKLVAERDAALAAVREGLSEEARRLQVERSQSLTLAKIRSFFGIE
jgi:small-conductance mechanosensitive channel/CRP-like cAMP-binding protein